MCDKDFYECKGKSNMDTCWENNDFEKYVYESEIIYNS